MIFNRIFICFVVCMCLLAALLSGCGQDAQPGTTTSTTTPTVAETTTCSITVLNEAGTALEKILVEIYSDETVTDILQFQKTDTTGTIRFNHKGSPEGLVAVLKDVPVGYQVDAYYPLTGADTIITLEAGAPITDDMLDTAQLSLGDAMPDFSFTASDGTQVVLSELLDEYSAVVLNFWYMGCTPCKMEFPYLQEAYEQFSDDVAVVAMNPMDSTDEAIEAFRQENGYSFLMGKCDMRWGALINATAYPTTIVVDRFGNITMIHKGAADRTQMFVDIFGYFCAENYEQSLIRGYSELPTFERKI